jgi:hypothetical protein
MTPSDFNPSLGMSGKQPATKKWLMYGGIALAGSAFLALILAWVSSGFRNVQTWLPFLVILIICSSLIYLGWWSIRKESPPAWLGGLLIGAALLRLAVGVIWYTSLPLHGYESPAERSGYVMSDAYDRDTNAWDLANSEKPLIRAFQGGYRRYDQYGGLLFVSAWIYRYLAGAHLPLMMVALTAAFSSLAILFTWAFARRAWDSEVAAIAAWLLVFYPEAVLMGSSQMREAFTVTLVAVAAYGLACFTQTHAWRSLLWVLGALLLCLPFSPPFAGLLLLLLVLLAFFSSPEILRGQAWRQRRVWMVLGLLALLILGGVWLSWGSYAPQGVSNPIELVQWWVKKSADWQAYLSERASGWVQKIFDASPEWTHAPMLLLYGVVQPFLPAALSDTTGALIWRGIALWRSIGWTALLVFLVYAPIRALRRIDMDRYTPTAIRSVLGLGVVVWLGIFIASYRGGGDQWDNPRYREAFASLQVALVAWAISAQWHRSDAWLRRALVGAGLILAWFLPWYLRRYVYLPWEVTDLFKTLGLGVASMVLYWIWDWAGSGKSQ